MHCHVLTVSLVSDHVLTVSLDLRKNNIKCLEHSNKIHWLLNPAQKLDYSGMAKHTYDQLISMETLGCTVRFDI